MKKLSFLERLSGKLKVDESEEDVFEEDAFEDEPEEQEFEDGEFEDSGSDWHNEPESNLDTSEEGELPVDVFHSDDEIVIRALVAGVSPDDLDISITREMVVLRGQREEIQEVADDEYYHRELFWGSFSREIMLPDEVVIDEAEAKEKHGLLEIRLPKLDKARTARLSVKSHHKEK